MAENVRRAAAAMMEADLGGVGDVLASVCARDGCVRKESVFLLLLLLLEWV